jgi:hypothetical protein
VAAVTSRSWTARIVLVGALAAGAVVNRAALHAPLDLDDFGQRAMIEGKLTPKRGPFNLYDLVADDNRAALLERGVIPWWSDPHLVVRFLRPLPSLLVWLDHRLFGYDAFAPHVLSFLWWAAAVLAAYVLYRTAMGTRPALAATAMFALSPTLAIPLVWLANRNILVTLTFGAAALALYVRWRNERHRPLGFASAAAFGATALTGEYALCLAGYLIAFEMCRPSEPARRRLTGVLPAAVPLVLYAAARAALGYSTTGSGYYRDPAAALGTYLEALPRAFSTLLASVWLSADVTSPWFASQLLRTILILGGGALVVGTAWSAQRQQSGASPSSGSWLACGSVIALLPLAATEPSRRLLGVAALGVSGAVGVLLENGARRVRRPLRLSAVVGVAAVAGLIHLVAAPLQTRRISLDAVDDQIEHLAQFNTVPHRARSVDTTLVVRAAYGLTVLSAPFLLREEAPKHWWVLSHTFEQTAAIRTSPSSLEVVQEKVPLFPLGPTGIVRTIPFSVGDVVQIPGLRATVLRIDDEGRPMAVRYEFDRDLDGPDVAWISEGRSGFSDVGPPPVGLGVRLGQ